MTGSVHRRRGGAAGEASRVSIVVRPVAAGLLAALGVGLAAFASGDALLWAIDRGLDKVTLPRMLVVLAALGVVQALVSVWLPERGALPEWRLSRVKASMAVGALVGLAAGAYSALNARVTVPTVFSDELIFISLAKSLARGDGPLVRGVETLGYGLAYPALLAPLYALVGDGAQAYQAAQVTNAVLMASAAVPTYLLARMVLERSDAVLVGGFTVGTPLLTYSGYVMTESLFYAAFFWTAYAVARALARPSTALQVVALGSLLGLCAVRPQAVVLIPATATAVGLIALTRGARADVTHTYRLLLGALLGVVLAGAGVRLLSSTSPLGAYDVLLAWPDPLELLTWAGRELCGLALAVGVVALVVFPIGIALMLRPSATREERAVAAVAATFVPWMIISVSLLDSSPYGLGWTHLRNVMTAIPLVLLVGVAWLRYGMPRPARPATVGAALAIGGALAVRAVDLVHEGRFDAPSFLPWRVLASPVFPIDRLLLVCVALAVVVALTTRAQWALPVSVVAAFLVIAPGVVPGATPPWGVERDRSARLAALDREVGPQGDALVVTAGLPDARCETHPLALAALWAEVLNTSANAGSLYRGDLIEAKPSLSIDRDGTLLRDGAPVTARAVAIDDRIAIDGVPIGTVPLRDLGGEFSDDPGGLQFWRTDGRVVVTDPAAVEALASAEGCPS